MRTCDTDTIDVIWDDTLAFHDVVQLRSSSV